MEWGDFELTVYEMYKNNIMWRFYKLDICSKNYPTSNVILIYINITLFSNYCG